MYNEIKRDNRRLLTALGAYLNHTPDFITGDIVKELCTECAVTAEEAYSLLLASALGLQIYESDADLTLYSRYFPHMVRKCDPSFYRNDPYFRTIRIPERTRGTWTLTHKCYKPYEAFVFDDFITLPDGRVIPQIGFFTEEFHYPCVLEDGREWMLITPNEIHTMADAIRNAHGHVLTYGLGMGYFAFMTGMRTAVEDVTIVERDARVIALFTEVLLPQFPCRDKLRIHCDDAFRFAKTDARGYDYIFADIWHDPSDGLEAYKRLKSYEPNAPGADFAYWIEPTLRAYLTDLI